MVLFILGMCWPLNFPEYSSIQRITLPSSDPCYIITSGGRFSGGRFSGGGFSGGGFSGGGFSDGGI